VTAFVGRALRGPVNRPVALGNFADYQQVFGGLWQPSMLSYAVEQFFENGGRDRKSAHHRSNDPSYRSRSARAASANIGP